MVGMRDPQKRRPVGLMDEYWPGADEPEFNVDGIKKGLLDMREFAKDNKGEAGLLAASIALPSPLGDAAGLGGDLWGMIKRPEDRTWANVGLAAAGLIPGIPAGLGMVKKMEGDGLGLPAFLDRRKETAVQTQLRKAEGESFHTDTPLYHGTRGPLESGGFDLSRGGENSGSSVGSVGVSLAEKPGLAEHFANLKGSSGANIIPAFYRGENVGRLDVSTDMGNNEVRGAILDAWDSGKDALRVTYDESPRGVKKEAFIIVKDPAQIRSIFAKFDPMKRNSKDILASLAAAGLLVRASDSDE